MPLIVEDGTGVVDSNTYIDIDDARQIAAMRGISLSVSDSELIGQLVSAADRLTVYEKSFTGTRVNGVQGLSFPRLNSYRYGSMFPPNAIPKELKLAQVVMAGILNSGLAIWAEGSAEGVTSEKIGPLQITYSATVVEGASVGNPDLPQIDAILDPLFAPVSINFTVGR